MAAINGVASLIKISSPTTSIPRRQFPVSTFSSSPVTESCSRVLFPIRKWMYNASYSSSSRIGKFRLCGSIELHRFLMSEDNKDEMSDEFFEAIEELERMARDPADVLEEMNSRLSSRELQLVLVYFSQEGRDSWCALEVFEWLQKENRVDKETMELMVSIMCGWFKKLIENDDHVVGDVIDLVVEMECVGLKPSFSVIEKVISLYWDSGKKEDAVLFVREILRRRISYTVDDDAEGSKGGPTGYLAWKMMVDGDFRGAAKLVIDFRECGLKPEAYSYLMAMTAVVKELNEVSKAMRKLKGYIKAGLVAELDVENLSLIETYQSELIVNGVHLSKWVIQEDSSINIGAVHERLLAMYVCAGRGLEAEQQLWEMKFSGKEPDGELFNIVLAICASQQESSSIARLLAAVESTGSMQRKKTLSWLLRGYIKGGHFQDASKTITKMLDMGIYPEYLDRAAVLQGLRKSLQESGNVKPYLELCKRLSDANLVDPCIVYLYIRSHSLWIINLL